MNPACLAHTLASCSQVHAGWHYVSRACHVSIIAARCHGKPSRCYVNPIHPVPACCVNSATRLRAWQAARRNTISPETGTSFIAVRPRCFHINSWRHGDQESWLSFGTICSKVGWYLSDTRSSYVSICQHGLSGVHRDPADPGVHVARSSVHKKLLMFHDW